MVTKSDSKNNDQPKSSDTAPEVVFESIYADSAPKLRNPDHLVHYELGKSGKNHAIRITSNGNERLFSNE